MNFSRPYAVFCLVVLGLVGLARYEGWALADTAPQYRGNSGSSGGSGSVYYTGTSSSGHK
jgi:hypothetical protein